MTLRRGLWLAGGAAVALVLAVVFRHVLVRGGLEAAIDLALGVRTQIAAAEVGVHETVLRGVHVQRGSGPLLDATQVTVSYDLRDLLPGSKHRFGLRGAELDNPVLTIRREADGTFNLPGGAAPATPSKPEQRPAPAGAPLALRLLVRNGTVVLHDPSRFHAISREQRLDRIAVAAAIDTSTRSHYVISAAYRTKDAGFPIRVSGTIDVPRAYAVHRVRAAALPLPAIVDYFINSNFATLTAGTARDVDVYAYALDPGSPYHLTGGAVLSGGTFALSVLRQPVRNLRGATGLFDDGFAADRLDASIAGTPLRIAGGVYNFSDPRLRMGVTAGGPIDVLRTLAAFSAKLPITGTAATSALIEGRALDPLVLGRFSVTQPAYGKIRIVSAHGTVGYYHQAIGVVPFVADYAGIGIRSYGAIVLGTQTQTSLALFAQTPASRVPYAAQIIPSAQLSTTAILAGTDARFGARGIAIGVGPDRLTALFAVDSNGEGVLGPLAVAQRGGGTVNGAYYLARRTSTSAFWVDARRLALSVPPKPPLLPGINVPALPAMSGELAATVGGEGPPSGFAIAGKVSVRDVALGPLHVADATANVLGSPTDLRMGAIAAAGPWGRFSGIGGFDGNGLLLDGRYRGSLEQLEPFTGAIGARGPLDAPVRMAVAAGGETVQTPGATTTGATVRGIPIDSVAGTIVAVQGDVKIYAANANVAGGRMVAAGSLRGGIGLSIVRADAARLRAAGLPLDAGVLAAVGTAAASSAGGLRFDGGAIVSQGRYGRIPVDGNGELQLNGSDLALQKVDAGSFGTWGVLGGTIAAVGTPAQRYALTAHVKAADVGDIAAEARIEGAARYHIDGSADADVTIGGVGRNPTIAGRVLIPEATVNGLFIEDGSANVHATPTSVAIAQGRVTVGTTIAQLDGELARRRSTRLRFDAPAADLSDFDNFFDEGDMLTGRGHVAFGLNRLRRQQLNTSGDVAMQALRVSHFYFGDARANWASAGELINGHAGFSGRNGAFDAKGSISVPRRGRLTRILTRSRFDLGLHATGLDVGAWTAALGYNYPIAGHIDAAGTVRGRYPALAISGNAALLGGSFGQLPIDKLTVAAHSSFSKATIDAADVAIGSITAHGSGSFGFRPTDPLALNLHASSPDLGSMVAEVTGNTLPLHGSFEADVKTAGNWRKPVVTGGFDVENATVAGVKVTRALGELALAGKNVELRDAEITFPSGALYLAGSIPFQLTPFALGPPAAPITLELAANAIDLGGLAPLLPQGSIVKGKIDGRVAVGGTVQSPTLTGALALAGGELLAPSLENVPFQNVNGRLSFSGTTARLETLHADAGSGTIDATGSASFPDLVRPGPDATFEARTVFSRAQIDLPAYGKGQLDGTLTVHHEPHTLALVGGSLALQDTVIPFSALYNPSSGTTASSASNAPTTVGDQTFGVVAPPATPLGLPNVAFDLTLTAGRNVRVRSSAIDIGASGNLIVTGTLAEPQLAGTFTSTGGTLTYFNRVFRIVDGTVTFAPGQGIIPILDARATTHVINPDPNAARNPTGSADIAITVRGPVTNLTIGLDSDPAYDRQQILGLLLSVPALGGTSLFDTPGTFPAPGTPTSGNGGISLGQEAFSILNAQFTRNLLAPIETGLGGALGLSAVNFTFDYTGSVGVSVRKGLGKNIYAVYATTIGYPYRETFGFEYRPNPNTAAQFTLFQTFGVVNDTLVLVPVTGAVSRVTVNQPITGQSGFTFSLQRFFP